MSVAEDQKTEIDNQSARGKHLGEKERHFLSGVPIAIRGIFTRALTGTASPRQAIKAKCIDCMGCEDYRNRVRDCKTTTCPAHPYRPYQPSDTDDEDEK